MNSHISYSVSNSNNTYLLDCISGGISSADQEGIAASSLAKQSSTFTKFQIFLSQCGIKDTFLDTYSQSQKALIMSGYAHHLRHRLQKSPTSKATIQGNSVATALSHVVQAFRQNLWADPTHDTTGIKSAILCRQIKAYRDSDPARKSQACLPIKVWLKLQGPQASAFHSAMGDLLTGALFFTMRSCEYTTTNTTDGPKKTKIVTCQCVRFYRHSKQGLTEIPQRQKLPSLPQADCVSITFISQKNGEKDITITQYKSGNKLDPVTSWAKIVHRVLSYKKTNLQSQVNTFYHTEHQRLVYITSAQTQAFLKWTVAKLGAKSLGIQISRVGTHSVRTSCAMLLYMAKVRTAAIMLLGRWKSDAFLLYLRRQVKEFTQGLSEAMASQLSMFHTEATATEPILTPAFTHATHDDPMTQNVNSLALSTTRFNGQSQTNTSSTRGNTTPPAFHLWG
jgi:hypothetical protein